MILNGSQIILECLLEQGVDTVFGYPGGAVLNIYDELYRYSDKITHILTAHEQGAAHAADGYSRTTGKTGVVIATSGPGATNLVTGIATAYMDSIPLVAITGNVATSLLGLDSFQEVDITGITMPITKHNFIVKDISQLADALRKAFFIANDSRKGPVLIDIPKDITAATYEYEPVTPPSHQLFTDDHDLQIAADIINRSERPFIYAGGGAVSSGAYQELAKLAEIIDAPVSLTLMGQCAFDNTSPRYTGMLGMHGTKTSSLAAVECDVMIVIGSRFSDRVTCSTSSFAQLMQNKKIIQFEIDPAEFNKNVSVHCTVNGDIKLSLQKLISLIKPQKHPEWMNKIYDRNKKYSLKQISDDPTDVLPQYVIETLHFLTGGKAIITTEVGQNQMWAAEFYKFKYPRTFASSGGLGTMGYGLGAAIGSKVGNPDVPVINIAGDGSFYMNMNELTTLAKYNLHVIELIFNNSVLGMVRQWQKLFYGGRFSQTNLEKDTDFELLGKALGIKAYTIRQKDDVLTKALSANTPVLINCIIDKDINVLPMVPAGASIAEPILEIK